MPPIAAIIPAIIGAGGAIGGGLLARSGSKSIADTQKSIADQQLALTKPAFNQAYSYYTNLMQGSPSQLMQAVGPDITNTNLFFQQAKQNALQSAFGRGGGLTASLTNLEGQRAATLSDLIGRARQGAPAALAGLATGNQTQALQALAGAQQTTAENTLFQQQALSGIGGFLTRLLSGTGGGGGSPSPTSFGAPALPSATVSGNYSPYSDPFSGMSVGMPSSPYFDPSLNQGVGGFYYPPATGY